MLALASGVFILVAIDANLWWSVLFIWTSLIERTVQVKLMIDQIEKMYDLSRIIERKTK